MAPPKGVAQNPLGRKKGVPNVTTHNARNAIKAFIENNSERLQRLLDEIEKESAKDAFYAIMSVVEYHIPKIQRTELQHLDENGAPARQAPMNVMINGVKSDLSRAD